ncbi:MAG: sigma-70 family RNA polymerase sigma factor [Chloroflexi bacterium]|nr:sigma-70 family RNA polymerase sigma factor [Chloroflexota bacterium]
MRAKRRPLTLNPYIARVIFYLDGESARIQALKCGDNEEWQRLGNFLSKRGQRLLRRFRDGSQVEIEAFYKADYPFDVPFEAWATTILNRQILARYTRSKDAANRPQAPESLDEPSNPNCGDSASLAEILADPRSLEPFERVEIQAELRHAIDMLRSPEQREVIIATYFEELDDAHIAKRLRKTKQAVYGLRLRALARLRVLLRDEPSERIRGKNT